MMKLLIRLFLFAIFWALPIGPAQAVKPPSDAEIARFLNHASFGATEESIAHVKELGSFEAYLNEQFNLPMPDYPVYEDKPTAAPNTCDSICNRDYYSAYPLQVRFFRNAITGQDQLRQRVAFALSQIVVASGQEYSIRHPSRLLPYLQILDKHAFGNYRQLLKEITLNPAMGVYLNMAGNNKWYPNENYARELLQLFSIGLFELNKDGTQKKGKGGLPIPTYDQSTIDNLSKVLTGWNLATSTQDTSLKSYSTPMIEIPENHETKAKVIFGNHNIPANIQKMGDELNTVLDIITTNSNVAPFISRQLIQHLVTSNPSPAYVARVATVFQNSADANDDHQMQQVIRAILLDKEALKPPSKTGGHLRAPVLWLTHLLRAFKTDDNTSDFVLSDSYLPQQYAMKQDVYKSPSVFNFYPPDFPVPNTKLQGPEFGIYSTLEAFNRANFAYALIYHTLTTNSNRPKGTWIDASSLQPLASDPNALISKLVSKMMPEINPKIQQLLVQIAATSPASERVQHAIYWMATSPQFMIEK